MSLINKLKNLLQCDLNEAVFHKLLEKNYSQMYRLAFAWTHNRHLSEDLVQEMMLKALEKRDQLDELTNLEPWLCKILHHLYIDKMRDEQKWQWTDDSQLESFSSPFSNNSQDLFAEQQLNQLQIAMSELNEKHRTIIALIDLQELSYQQAAQVLNLPEGTIMSRLSRARKQLKTNLEQNKNPNKNSKTSAQPGLVVSLRRAK